MSVTGIPYPRYGSSLSPWKGLLVVVSFVIVLQASPADSSSRESYRTRDGRSSITLVSGNELEYRVHDGTIYLYKYSIGEGSIRAVQTILGTQQILYFHRVPEGLRSGDGTLYLSPAALAEAERKEALARQAQEKARAEEQRRRAEQERVAAEQQRVAADREAAKQRAAEELRLQHSGKGFAKKDQPLRAWIDPQHSSTHGTAPLRYIFEEHPELSFEDHFDGRNDKAFASFPAGWYKIVPVGDQGVYFEWKQNP